MDPKLLLEAIIAYSESPLEALGVMPFRDRADALPYYIAAIHVKACERLDPGTRYQIRLRDVQDFGRRRHIAWYTDEHIQSCPLLEVDTPVREQGCGVLTLGIYEVPHGQETDAD